MEHWCFLGAPEQAPRPVSTRGQVGAVSDPGYITGGFVPVWYGIRIVPGAAKLYPVLKQLPQHLRMIFFCERKPDKMWDMFCTHPQKLGSLPPFWKASLSIPLFLYIYMFLLTECVYPWSMGKSPWLLPLHSSDSIEKPPGYITLARLLGFSLYRIPVGKNHIKSEQANGSDNTSRF